MSKLYRKPIEVQLAGDVPGAFLWRGKWLQVEQVTQVRRVRSWMEPVPGDTFRVYVRAPGVLEKVWD